MAMPSIYPRRDEPLSNDPSSGRARRGTSEQGSMRPPAERMSIPPVSTRRGLIIDEDQAARRSILAYLTRAGAEVDIAEDVTSALQRLQTRAYDIVLCDVRVSRSDDGSLAEMLKSRCDECAVVLTSAFATTENVTSAMSNGVYDYLLKPVEPQHLASLLMRVERHHATQRRSVALHAALSARDALSTVFMSGPAMSSVLATVRRASATAAPVLIVGEPGSGRSTLARAIHGVSARADGPIEVVDCARDEAAVARDLVGAVGEPGPKLRAARGGTLVLEAVGALAPSLRPRLMQCLAAAEGVRVIAINDAPLGAPPRRESRTPRDLFAWLHGVEIVVPPLREHREDIPRLVEHFASAVRGSAAPTVRVAPEVMAALIAAPWSGNLRELESVVRDAVLAAGSAPVVTREHLPESLRARVQDGSSLTAQVEAYERAVLRYALESAQGQVGRAARSLGVPERTLRRKMRHFGIAKESFRKRGRSRRRAR